MSLFDGTTMDDAITEMQADMVEAHGHEPVVTKTDTGAVTRTQAEVVNLGPAVTAELGYREQDREWAEAEQQEQRAEYVASIRRWEPAPDGSYAIERAGGIIEHHEPGTGPFAEEALQFGAEQAGNIVEAANGYIALGNAYPSFWADLETESPAEYHQALQLIAMAESIDDASTEVQTQTSNLESLQAQLAAAGQALEAEHPGAGQRFLEALQSGEATDPAHARQIALAGVDLPSSIAHNASERAGLAETARALNAAGGWDTGHGDWQEEARLARDLAVRGVDPFDADTVDEIMPHVVANEGNVPAALRDHHEQTTAEDAEFEAELTAHGVDPDSQQAHEISLLAWKQTEGDVDEAVALWRRGVRS